MIFDRLKEIIAELFSAVEGDISEDTDLYEDLYADSLDMYELSIVLEEEFDLTRRDIAKMKDFCTVGEILNYITEN